MNCLRHAPQSVFLVIVVVMVVTGCYSTLNSSSFLFMVDSINGFSATTTTKIKMPMHQCNNGTWRQHFVRKYCAWNSKQYPDHTTAPHISTQSIVLLNHITRGFSLFSVQLVSNFWPKPKPKNIMCISNGVHHRTILAAKMKNAPTVGNSMVLMFAAAVEVTLHCYLFQCI